MTKSKSIFIICLALLIAVFSGCSSKENYSESQTQTSTTVVTTAETTEEKTVSESTTEQESSSESTTKTIEQKSAGQTTEKKVTTTQKQTTTKSQTTTKKVTTTKKQTTTKKVTTTATPYWCDEGGSHHIVEAGPIGWCDSFDEATDKALEYISEHGDSGNFRVKQCYGCGKYTATVTIH